MDPFKRYVQERLATHPALPATVLLREIRARGYQGQISILKDFVRPIRKERRRLKALTVRFETGPGQQAQGDWAHFGRLVTGQRLYAFVLLLSFSRMLFVRFYERMREQELLRGLSAGFEYFGGWPHQLLLDNMRTVVLRRGRSVKESRIHPQFLDFIGYYGIQLQLCEPARPQTKGKVERGIGYMRNSLVLPPEMTNVREANVAASVWLDTVANVRQHATTGSRPVDLLAQEELTPFGSRAPYDLSWVEPRRVSKDCHFSWKGNRYSVPYRHGGQAVLVRQRPSGMLEVERAGELIAVHRPSTGGGRTITVPAHVQGLWRKTMGRHRRSDVQVDSAGVVDIVVERADLSEYDALLEPRS